MGQILGILIGVMVPVVGIGVLTILIVGIVQEGKTMGRGEAVRSAFTYVVSLVMLAIIVVASIFLLQQGARAWVFTKAQPTTTSYVAMPPQPYFPSLTKATPAAGAIYYCQDGCKFTDEDKTALTQWKTDYAAWRTSNAGDPYVANQKRDTINALSFLIVALPLFFWFFLRSAQREAKRLREQSHGKPGPTRTIYYYLIAFTGLIGVVASSALLLNLGLKSAFHLQTPSTSGPKVVPTAIDAASFDTNGVKSILNCADKCSFTAEDRQLAQQWLDDYATWQKNNSAQQYPSQSTSQTDLANLIPILLVSAPLFFYHFFAIRRESREHDLPPAPGAPIVT